MSYYKKGQIITLTHGKYKFICRVVQSENSCDSCEIYKYIKQINNKYGVTAVCWRFFKLRNIPFNCTENLGLHLNLKIIKYVKI